MHDWTIKMEVWPGMSGAGQDADQQACGGRQRSFDVKAEEISDALAIANHIITGIQTNPRVWRCHITSIEKTRR
jgi:hypothetical protein